MIIDTGGLLIVLLVLVVPPVTYLIMRGKRSRQNDLLAQIRERQAELGPGDPLSEIRSARTDGELDAAMRRAQVRSEIATLTSRLPPELRDRLGRES